MEEVREVNDDSHVFQEQLEYIMKSISKGENSKKYWDGYCFALYNSSALSFVRATELFVLIAPLTK